MKELLKRYRELKEELELVERQIQEQAQALLKPGEKVEAEGVKVIYSKGRGSYNWMGLAYYLEPDEELIKQHTKEVIDYKALVEAMKPDKDLVEKFYTPGNPQVKIEVGENK